MQEEHQELKSKWQILFVIISAILVPIISHVVSSILQHTNIQITITIQAIQYEGSIYLVSFVDIMILLMILILNKRILNLKEEIEYLHYKLYRIRRRKR